ncbi:hypothetical protein [uncultured Granulicatella sp.]|uniref:hypothetical protein n=1 Tax=uncultured Granulicatella sp. TaxID=316089 RepID=UPI0028D4252C|nr:hypothetical protein [uncultured Granulicatella sp.]
MSPIISDAVVIAFLGGIVSIITAQITAQSKRNAEIIANKISDLNKDITEFKKYVSADISELKKDVSDVKEIGGKNRDGIRQTQRYRLYKEMTRDIKAEQTTLSRSNEISKLYHSYEVLGGNGEIHDLYEIYKKLPVRPDNN